MGRTVFRISVPDAMVEKFEGLINNINSLSNGAYVIIEGKSKKKDIVAIAKEEIVATPNGEINDG